MVSDRVRHESYVRALKRHVTPRSVVLDIGTGTGVYALIAARLGARRVFGVDPNPLIQLGRQHARDNGVDDRVTFVLGTSDALTLPEPADVIVTDLHNTLPFNGGYFSALGDAHRRLLAPGGVVLPARDVVRVAVVERPQVHAETTGPWTDSVEGLDLSAALELEANTMRFGHCEAPDLLSPPMVFADLRYDADAGSLQDRVFELDVEVAAVRSGTAHAIVLWFDVTVDDGIDYSTGPDSAPTVYRQAFLPLRRPIPIAQGEPIHVEVSCRYGDAWNWQWQVESSGAAGSPWRQSTLRALSIPDETVRLLHGDSRITEWALLERDAAILGALAGGDPIGAVINRTVAETGMEPAAAASLVAGLVHRYVTHA